MCFTLLFYMQLGAYSKYMSHVIRIPKVRKLGRRIFFGETPLKVGNKNKTFRLHYDHQLCCF